MNKQRSTSESGRASLLLSKIKFRKFHMGLSDVMIKFDLFLVFIL